MKATGSSSDRKHTVSGRAVEEANHVCYVYLPRYAADRDCKAGMN